MTGTSRSHSTVEQLLDTHRLPITGELLLGRDPELARLDAAWASPRIGVVTVVGRGGEGKSALVNEWISRQAPWAGDVRVYGWTFYSQGVTAAGGASADLFFAQWRVVGAA